MINITKNDNVVVKKTLTKTKDKSFAADKNTCEEKQAEFQVKKAMGTL